MLLRAGDSFRAAAPILRREFVALLRTRRAFWMAVLTVAGASLIPLLHWPSTGEPMADQNAREAFWTWNIVFHAALLLFVPAVAGTSFPQERERGTFELLLAAPISPVALLLGKLLASTGFFLLLVLLTFPVAALLYLLGGFAAWELGAALALLLSSVLLLGLMGIVSSMRSRKALHGIGMTYGCLLLSLATVAFLSPFMAISPLTGLILMGFILFLISSLVWRRIRAMSLDLPPPSAAEPRALPDRTPIPRRFPSWRREGIPDDWNPVLAAAVLSGTGWEFRAAAVGLTILGLLLVMVGAASHGAPIVRLLVFFLASLALFLTASAASGLQAERQEGKLDLLRSSLLGPREILSGKLQAAFLSAGPLIGFQIACLALLLLVTMAAVGPGGFLVIVLCLPVAPVLALYAASAGLLGGALATTLPRALVISYAVVGGPLLVSLSLLGGEHPLSTYLSPLVAYPLLAAHAVAGEPLPEALVVYLVSLVTGALLAWLQYRLALVAMEKRWMRDP